MAIPKSIQIPCTGYSIVADEYEGSRTEVLLALPGYSSSRKRLQELVESIVATNGMSAICVDYSGHGDSPFELRDTRPAQHFLEVVYAFDWIVEHFPDASITLLGSSYGGFLATQLTKYRSFSKLVLKVPAIYKPESFYDPWSLRFDDIENYTKTTDIYRRDADALSKHPLLARASRFAGETLVIVHEHDEMVPRETTDAYIRAFGADSFVQPGFQHTIAEIIDDDRVSKETLAEYQAKIAGWINGQGL